MPRQPRYELTTVPQHVIQRGKDSDSREVDAFALSQPLPEYELDQRVNW